MSENDIDKNDPVAMKKHFIEKARPLLDNYLEAALGEGILLSSDGDSREEVWNLLKSFITKADEKLTIPEEFRGTPEGVLKAVENGAITLEEGERLLNMHYIIAKSKQTDVPPGGQLNQTLIPSLTINTGQLPAPATNTEGQDE